MIFDDIIIYVHKNAFVPPSTALNIDLAQLDIHKNTLLKIKKDLKIHENRTLLEKIQ